MIALAGRPGPGSSTSILGLYRRVWDFAQGARVQYAAAMFLLAASMVVKLLIPWLAAQAINTVQVQGAATVQTFWPCVPFVAVPVYCGTAAACQVKSTTRLRAACRTSR